MLGPIEDPQVKIKVPESEVEFLKDKLEKLSDKLPENLKKVISNGEGEVRLTVSDLKWLKMHGNLETPLHELLSRWVVELPEPTVIPRNPELEARIQRLKLEQLERDYQSMTKNVDSFRSLLPDDTIGSQIKQINRQLIAVFQFVMSVGAGFAFGFIGIELIVGDLDFGFRLLLGVMCALIIALAEIYFLAKKLAEDVFPPPQMYKRHQD